MRRPTIAAVTFTVLSFVLGGLTDLQASADPSSAGGANPEAGATPTATGSAGDANGDGIVTSADVFYLINNIFAGGPAPVSIAGAATVSVRFEQVFDAGTWQGISVATPILGPFSVTVSQSQRIWVQSSAYVEYLSGNEVWTQIVVAGASNNTMVSVWAVAKDDEYYTQSDVFGNNTYHYFWRRGQTLTNQFVTPPLVAGAYSVYLTGVSSKTTNPNQCSIRPGDRSMFIGVLAQ